MEQYCELNTDATGLFSQEFNCCDLFVPNLWRKNLCCIRRKHEPVFRPMSHEEIYSQHVPGNLHEDMHAYLNEHMFSLGILTHCLKNDLCATKAVLQHALLFVASKLPVKVSSCDKALRPISHEAIHRQPVPGISKKICIKDAMSVFLPQTLKNRFFRVNGI